MKHSRTIFAITVAAALAVAGVAPAASADPATQPLTLLGPSNGQKLATPYVPFSWQAPADEQSVEIVVSTSATTGASGKLPQSGKKYLTSEWIDSPGASTFVDKKYAYSPGTYYWQVETTDGAGTEYLSRVRKFVVPVFFQLSKVKLKMIHEAYNGKRALAASVVMKCNYAQDQYYTQFSMDVYKGSKRISHGAVAQGNCVGMYPIKTEGLFEPSASLKSGTKLTIKLYGHSTNDSTVRWGGAAIKKAKGAVTTLHYTYKK